MNLNDVESFAPVVTATIASIALVVAVTSIWVQRNIARKRAALDFFLKTELDRTMVETLDTYSDALESVTAETNLEEFSNTPAYKHVQAFLNIHELIAVGVRKGVLDDKVCFDFWSDETFYALDKGRRVIEFGRNGDGQ